MIRHAPVLSHHTWQEIVAHVNHARTKHEVFPKSNPGKAAVLIEEVWELLKAMAFEGPERTRQEAMDVIAVCIRIFEGE